MFNRGRAILPHYFQRMKEIQVFVTGLDIPDRNIVAATIEEAFNTMGIACERDNTCAGELTTAGLDALMGTTKITVTAGAVTSEFEDLYDFGNVHPEYSLGDWMQEAGQLDTLLGYNEWVHHKLEANEEED